jgi:hypothetical protein
MAAARRHHTLTECYARATRRCAHDVPWPRQNGPFRAGSARIAGGFPVPLSARVPWWTVGVNRPDRPYPPVAPPVPPPPVRRESIASVRSDRVAHPVWPGPSSLHAAAHPRSVEIHYRARTLPVSPDEVEVSVLFRNVSRTSRRLLISALGTVSVLAVLVPIVASEPDTTPAAAQRMFEAELEFPVHAHPATGVLLPEPPPAPPFPEWELHEFEAGLEPAGFELEVVAVETQPTRRAAEPVEPEPAQGECPPNSSPDCAFTYRVPLETWERVADCESNGRWDINTGNGYYGGLQFNLSSWQWVGGSSYPHEHSKWVQIHFAERLLDRQGWVAWPACSSKLGLR